MKVNKDLGQSTKEYFGEGVAITSSPDSDKVHYPTFNYAGSEELGIPKSGTMTVKYKEVSSTHSDRDGKKRYECTVEIQEIISVNGGDVKAPTKSGSEAGDALDKLAKEKSDAKGNAEEDEY